MAITHTAFGKKYDSYKSSYTIRLSLDLVQMTASHICGSSIDYSPLYALRKYTFNEDFYVMFRLYIHVQHGAYMYYLADRNSSINF